MTNCTPFGCTHSFRLQVAGGRGWTTCHVPTEEVYTRIGFTFTALFLSFFLRDDRVKLNSSPTHTHHNLITS